jgi:hexosaminidase
LVNGVRGSTDHHYGECQGWIPTNKENVVDLQQASEISNISVGSLQNSGAGIVFPVKMDFFVSTDGVKFQKVAEVVNEVDPLSGEKQLKDFSASFNPVTASFVKVIAKNPGKFPSDGSGKVKATWIFIDEISVE